MSSDLNVKIRQALGIIHSLTPGNNTERHAAQQFLDSLVQHPEVTSLAVSLLSVGAGSSPQEANADLTAHFGLQLLQKCVRQFWSPVSKDVGWGDKAKGDIRNGLSEFYVGGMQNNRPRFVLSKLLDVMCDIAIREWPAKWSDLVSSLLKIGAAAETGAQAVWPLKFVRQLADSTSELPDLRKKSVRKGLINLCEKSGDGLLDAVQHYLSKFPQDKLLMEEAVLLFGALSSKDCLDRADIFIKKQVDMFILSQASNCPIAVCQSLDSLCGSLHADRGQTRAADAEGFVQRVIQQVLSPMAWSPNADSSQDTEVADGHRAAADLAITLATNNLAFLCDEKRATLCSSVFRAVVYTCLTHPSMYIQSSGAAVLAALSRRLASGDLTGGAANKGKSKHVNTPLTEKLETLKNDGELQALISVCFLRLHRHEVRVWDKEGKQQPTPSSWPLTPAFAQASACIGLDQNLVEQYVGAFRRHCEMDSEEYDDDLLYHFGITKSKIQTVLTSLMASPRGLSAALSLCTQWWATSLISDPAGPSSASFGAILGFAEMCLGTPAAKDKRNEKLVQKFLGQIVLIDSEVLSQVPSDRLEAFGSKNRMLTFIQNTCKFLTAPGMEAVLTRLFGLLDRCGAGPESQAMGLLSSTPDPDNLSDAQAIQHCIVGLCRHAAVDALLPYLPKLGERLQQLLNADPFVNSWCMEALVHAANVCLTDTRKYMDYVGPLVGSRIKNLEELMERLLSAPGGPAAPLLDPSQHDLRKSLALLLTNLFVSIQSMRSGMRSDILKETNLFNKIGRVWQTLHCSPALLGSWWIPGTGPSPMVDLDENEWQAVVGSNKTTCIATCDEVFPFQSKDQRMARRFLFFARRACNQILGMCGVCPVDAFGSGDLTQIFCQLSPTQLDLLIRHALQPFTQNASFSPHVVYLATLGPVTEAISRLWAVARQGGQWRHESLGGALKMACTRLTNTFINWLTCRLQPAGKSASEDNILSASVLYIPQEQQGGKKSKSAQNRKKKTQNRFAALEFMETKSEVKMDAESREGTHATLDWLVADDAWKGILMSLKRAIEWYDEASTPKAMRLLPSVASRTWSTIVQKIDRMPVNKRSQLGQNLAAGFCRDLPTLVVQPVLLALATIPNKPEIGGASGPLFDYCQENSVNGQQTASDLVQQTAMATCAVLSIICQFFKSQCSRAGREPNLDAVLICPPLAEAVQMLAQCLAVALRDQDGGKAREATGEWLLELLTADSSAERREAKKSLIGLMRGEKGQGTMGVMEEDRAGAAAQKKGNGAETNWTSVDLFEL